MPHGCFQQCVGTGWHSVAITSTSLLPRLQSHRGPIPQKNMWTLVSFLRSFVSYCRYISQICGDMGPHNQNNWGHSWFTVLMVPIFRPQHNTEVHVMTTVCALLGNAALWRLLGCPIDLRSHQSNRGLRFKNKIFGSHGFLSQIGLSYVYSMIYTVKSLI